MRTSRSRPLRAGRPAVAAVATLSVALTGISPADAAPAADPVHRATTHHVTLITGDRVTVTGGDRVSIDPGPGRKTMTFKSYRTRDRLTVIPADQLAQVASGRLDRRLFDVTGLIEAGYDDAHSRTLPLIVTYTTRARRAKLSGATRELPILNGTAVEVPRQTSPTFLRERQIKKIWLDGVRKPLLDQSVAQIGAPAAWQAGYTGKDVTVAVLDTGIDSTHPDLASQIAGARNFTDSPDGDQVGHGTHVASTIAGTGAAADGKYRGVAPDAKLYDGKVCQNDGCWESAILAGLEWAATEVKAKVVNLSLGGPDSPELDPLEEAVNRLTAETGTLFVVAAGNSGDRPGTISSPGSADAALTVGAVDRHDQLAGFSSRGPRVGDGAIKPDVTVPGVGIVAARSKDATSGEPVGDQYLRMSGTSMATPHTAGAAALLAQQHPEWKAAELKAAVMSSARSIEGQTVFEQGAGRLDVAAAVQRPVIADPGSVSFGTARWPHHDDDPVTRSVTYRNSGDQPVTLSLTAGLTGPDGKPAPAAAVQLSASTITVPAGGAAAVELTSDTRHDGADGTYVGRITGTGGGSTLSTAIAVDKEAESYQLTVKHLGLDGEPVHGLTQIYGVDAQLEKVAEAVDGTSTFRLPRGEYLVEGNQRIPAGMAAMVQPSLRLTADSTVVFDARTTRKSTVTVPQSDAVQADGLLGYQRNGPSGPVVTSVYSSDRLNRFQTAHLGPALPADQLTGFVNTHWGKPAGDSFDGSPFWYATSNTFPGAVPAGFERAAQFRELAVIEQTLHQTSDRVAFTGAWARPPGVIPGAISAPVVAYPLPATRKLFADPDPVSWQLELDEVEPGSEFPFGPVKVISWTNKYQAGHTYRKSMNAAVFAVFTSAAIRRQNELLVELGLVDGAGSDVLSQFDSGSTKVYRDGELVYDSPGFGSFEVPGLPAGEATLRVESSLSRPSITPLSSRVEHSWTFRSAASDTEAKLPLLSVRYQAAVNEVNAVRRTAVTKLPVSVLAQAGVSLPKLRTAEVQVSADGGKTWQNASVVPTGKGRYEAVFRTPASSSVSLKAKVVDSAGNVTEQTVIDAYLLK